MTENDRLAVVLRIAKESRSRTMPAGKRVWDRFSDCYQALGDIIAAIEAKK